METKSIPTQPSLRPAALTALPRGRHHAHGVQALPREGARGGAPRRLATVAHAVAHGPTSSAATTGRAPTVADCTRMLRAALSTGGQSAFLKLCARVCKGGNPQRCRVVLEAAMHATSPRGADDFRAAAILVSAVVGERDDDAWGTQVLWLWRAVDAAQEEGAGSVLAQGPSLRHLMACLGAAIQVEGDPGERLQQAIELAAAHEEFELAADACMALRELGMSATDSVATVLLAGNLRAARPLIERLLLVMPRDVILSGIRALMQGTGADGQALLSPEDGAEFLVELAFAAFDDDLVAGGARGDALRWVAAQASPAMRPHVLDHLFRALDGCSAPALSPAMRELARMVENAAPEVDLARAACWAMEFTAITGTGVGSAASALRPSQPAAPAPWAALAKACGRDPLGPALFDCPDLDPIQKLQVATTALRLGHWSPEETRAQLACISSARNLRRTDRILLLARVLEAAESPARHSHFLEGRNQALRQWSLVAREGASAADPSAARDELVGAGHWVRLLYRCWAEQRGWVDADGRLESLSGPAREGFGSFLETELDILRETSVRGARPDGAISLLEGYATQLAQQPRPRKKDF